MAYFMVVFCFTTAAAIICPSSFSLSFSFHIVSVLAVEEYEELQVNFELEKNLRKRAESFAQEVWKLTAFSDQRTDNSKHFLNVLKKQCLFFSISALFPLLRCFING